MARQSATETIENDPSKATADLANKTHSYFDVLIEFLKKQVAESAQSGNVSAAIESTNLWQQTLIVRDNLIHKIIFDSAEAKPE